jgi:replicative DNA helicase
MPGKELMRNIWAASLRINSHNIRLGSLLDEDITRIKNFKIGIKDNLFIDDTSSVTYQYIETKVRRIRRSVPMSEVMVVFIDYIQLMKNIPEETKGISSEEQISLRCNGLLELSKKYNLCVIELSQFARGLVTFDKDKGTIARKPEISDFKGSGGIEANAVQCWLLYREEYYYKDATNTAVKGLCEINIAKNRYGPTGRIYTKFLPKYSSFEDYVKDESEGGDLI